MNYKALAFGWIVGYFLMFYPFVLLFPHNLIDSLINSIIGLSVAVGILFFGREYGTL